MTRTRISLSISAVTLHYFLNYSVLYPSSEFLLHEFVCILSDFMRSDEFIKEKLYLGTLLFRLSGFTCFMNTLLIRNAYIFS